MQFLKFLRPVCFTAVMLLQFEAVSICQDRSLANGLTPRQLEIETLRARLSSADVEDRREALARLGAMHEVDASRAVLSGLTDPLPIIRATAASSIMSLPAEEIVAALVPLLNDKDEFVRREVAYALGRTRSNRAVARLGELLLTDKEDGVRGAAAVALGEIGDAAAVVPLAAVLNPPVASPVGKRKKKSKGEQNPFVLRSAARSLGQIGDRAASPTLIMTLENEKAEDDVRREAATALGQLRDVAALPALRSALVARDPYLVEAAAAAIQKISRSNPR